MVADKGVRMGQASRLEEPLDPPEAVRLDQRQERSAIRIVIGARERRSIELAQVTVNAEPSEQRRLGDQADRHQPAALACSRQAGEVDVRGDVLRPDVPEGVTAEGVSAVGQ